MTNHSEVARLREQIEAECQAAYNGLYGLSAGSARHEFINARMERAQQSGEQLIAAIGEEQAAPIIAAAMEAASEKKGEDSMAKNDVPQYSAHVKALKSSQWPMFSSDISAILILPIHARSIPLRKKGVTNMPHPLVVQLRFTRSEFTRALAGLNDADARHRFGPMNSIGWVLGHLAYTEQKLWLTSMQGQTPRPHLDEIYGSGQPASTPPLAEMWEAWQTITQMADPLLDTLTTQMLQITNAEYQRTTGSLLIRIIYHYWYHTGEIMAIRQLLGHADLPEFVGDLDTQAPYLPH